MTVVAARTMIRTTVSIRIPVHDDDVTVEEIAGFDCIINGGIGYAYNIACMIMPALGLKDDVEKRDGGQGSYVYSWERQNSGQNAQNSGPKVFFQVILIPLSPAGWLPIEGDVEIEEAEDDPNLSKNKVLVQGSEGEVLCFENDAGYWNVELPDGVRMCRWSLA